jgi:hypothetical protein
MCLLWKLNGQRKSFVLTDHDPSINKYLKFSMDDLSYRIEKLETEEKELEEKIRANYASAKEIIDNCSKQKNRSLQGRRRHSDLFLGFSSGK